MFKAAIIAVSLASVSVLAIAIGSEGASANNTTKLIDQSAVSVQQNTGVVDCASQIWPRIDAYCLRPVSEIGEVRMARIVQM